MDLDRLRLFQTVCEEGNMTRAAVRLFRTQPAVSMQLRALEGEAGARLLVRTRRGVRPTAEGLRLLSCCAEFFRAYERLRESWSASDAECELSVACGDTVARYFLAPILKDFVRLNPKTRIHVVQSATPDSLNRLRRGEVDVAFVLRPVVDRQLAAETVLRYRHVAAVPQGWRGGDGGKGTTLDPRELARAPLVLLQRGTQTRRLVDEAFRAKGIAPEQVLDVASVSLQKEMVRCGLGIGVLPSYAIEKKDRLCGRPIAGACVREVAVVWRKDLPLTRAMQSFLSRTGTEARRQQRLGRRGLAGDAATGRMAV